MAQQTTTYEKLDQLLVLCNEIRKEMLARRVVATDLLEMNENHALSVLSTHIPDEERVYDIKRDLKRLDEVKTKKL
jgi:hypothetical protein